MRVVSALPSVLFLLHLWSGVFVSASQVPIVASASSVISTGSVSNNNNQNSNTDSAEHMETDESTLNVYKRAHPDELFGVLECVDADTTVFIARQAENPQKLVAIKMIKITGYEQLSLVEQLVALRCVSGMARCVQGLAWGTFYDNVYITTEYTPGVTLADYLSEKGRVKLSVGEIMTVFKDISEAIRQAREQSVAHCDLTAKNILLDRSGYFSLTGFDKAMSLSLDDPYHLVKFRGTLQNAAPEMLALLFQASTIDRRQCCSMDVWSLGVLMYELMTGRVPFNVADIEGETLAEKAQRLWTRMRNHRPDFSQIKTFFGEDCAQLIDRMLTFDRRARLQAGDVVSSRCLLNFDPEPTRQALRTKLLVSPHLIKEPECGILFSSALTAHAQYRSQQVSRIIRFSEGLKELVDNSCSERNNLVDLDAFLDAPSSFSLDRLFSRSYMHVGDDSILSWSFFLGKGPDGGTVMVQVHEAADEQEIFFLTGNELAVMSRLGLIREGPYLFHGNIAVIRNDLFWRDLSDVQNCTADWPIAVKDSLIVDLIEQVKMANSAGVRFVSPSPRSLAIRHGGTLGVYHYKGAHIDGCPYMAHLELRSRGYCAPELLRSLRTQATAIMDAWSVGMIAFELIAGELPFDMDTEADSEDLHDYLNLFREQYAQITSQQVDFGLLEGKVSPSIIAIIKGLLQVDPLQRLSLHSIDTASLSGLKCPQQVVQVLSTMPSPGRNNFLKSAISHYTPPPVDAMADDPAEQVKLLEDLKKYMSTSQVPDKYLENVRSPDSDSNEDDEDGNEDDENGDDA